MPLTSPLSPGSILPSSIGGLTNPLDNVFSATPGAGLGTPMVATQPPPVHPGAPTPAPATPPATNPGSPLPTPTGPTTPTASTAPLLPTGATPPVIPGQPPLPNTSLPTLPVNSTLPINPMAPRNGTLDSLAPGTIRTDATSSSALSGQPARGPPDSGLGGLVTAGIVVASVVLASMIGIFLFRKWKLRPKYRDDRLNFAPSNHHRQSWDPVPNQSSLPFNNAYRANTPPQMAYVVGDEVRQTPPTADYHHGVLTRNPSNAGSAHHYPQYQQNPALMQGRTVEMDLALRHHLRNG